MVAVIKTGHSLHRILNYNENKVKEGVAKCIGEGNYPIDYDQLTFSMKLNYMLRYLERNTNVTRNSVHISLNFSPSDRELSRDNLMQIADDYMERIGFGDQPYLVYQHHDAAHAHIHIVSIKIRRDGSRMDMNNIGRNESETARKAIEKEYGLVSAEAQKKQVLPELKPLSVPRALYGKAQTKAAIQKVLVHVVEQYRFASLAELNAVLRQYNVKADRGTENSRVFKHEGLLYRMLDEKGMPVGVPIKASAFYNKPTLKNLEAKYDSNKVKRAPYKNRVKNAIDMALMGGKISLEDLITTLKNQGVHVALRQADTGLIYGVTYVDHTTKCVFNGSELGKQYSAKAIQERCQPSTRQGQHLAGHAAPLTPGLQQTPHASLAETKEPGLPHDTTNILDTLLQPEQSSDYVPYPLKGNKKRRRKNKRKGI